MVGFNYKSPIVFYDVNKALPTDPAWDREGEEQLPEQPQSVEETVDEEQRLIGEPTCKCRCKDKQKCKHKCCKGVAPLKKGGNFTQAQYLTLILKEHIEPIWRKHFNQGLNFILMEDNDGSHGTRSKDNPVRRYKESLFGFKWYSNLAQSPDLNIIENVWRILKQRVKQRYPQTVDELRYWIKYEWNRIDQEEINKLVDSMLERVRQCWNREGLHTKW